MPMFSAPGIVISASSRRSGSTWLQRIIHASTDTFVWGESYPLVELLSTIFANFQNNETVQAQEVENFLSKKQDPTIWTAHINPPISNLIRANAAFISEYYSGSDRPNYGWKEFHYSEREIKFLHQIFPKTKIILLVRNPLDIVRSLAGQGWIGKYEDTSDIEMISRNWSERTRDYLALKDDPRFFLIRYEDITSRLSEILEFVGGKFSDNSEQAFKTYAGESKNLSVLAPEEEELIIRICAEEMLALGYLEERPETRTISKNSEPSEEFEPERWEASFSKVQNSAMLAFRREVLMVKSRSNELQQKVVEGEEQARLLQNQISQKDQELARLQAELVLVQGELHRIQTTTLYRSIRTGVKNVLRKILPAWLKEFLKKITGRALPVEPVQLPMLPPASAGVLIDKAGWGDFFESITLLPSLTRKDQRAILAHPPLDILLRRPDIICFSIIDWDFRYQRPQQIMSQFAAQGYRVFYISPVYFRTSDSTPKVQVQKIKENIYEVKLAVQRIPDMFGEVIEGVNSQVILASLDELRLVYKVEEAISYVMIASWEIVALETKKKWAWRVVYDCMDEWNNFPLIKPAIITGEQHLVENCDLLVVTSQRLYDNWRDRCRLMVLARNATDYQFYAQRLRPNELLTGRQHPIIGYYGAIADWFDLELMTYVAEQRPGYTFVLLGGIFDMDVSHLQALSNVNLLGQQPYETMPQYLYHFDVCLIPFKINTITEATDPVKVYEYLCGGKPVVSVALPELNSFRDLLYIAQDKDEFLVKLDQAVAEHNPQLVAQRKEFAQKNTWEKRYEVIAGGITSYTPRASIIVVTHNNLVLTRLCIESIFRNTDYPDFEVIVVDNNSTDGTRAYLGLLANQRENFKVILNPTNIGLAKANNQGLVSATGDYLILLENHVIVSPGWLSRMTLYLSDAKVGMVGPLTNFAGNEARLNLAYSTLGEMQTFAGKSTRQNEKTAVEITRLGMFCVAFRRDVFQIAGPLDERNKIGKLEEDDFAKRLRQSGYKIICAQDVFVHRFDRAAFAKWPLQPLFEKIQLWVENKRTVM